MSKISIEDYALINLSWKTSNLHLTFYKKLKKV